MSTADLFMLPREVEIRWHGEPRMALFTRSPDTVAGALRENPSSAYITINEMPQGTAANQVCLWTR